MAGLQVKEIGEDIRSVRKKTKPAEKGDGQKPAAPEFFMVYNEEGADPVRNKGKENIPDQEYERDLRGVMNAECNQCNA
jgi:hypothetical protein